ncbi:nucleotide-binding universal stress UspA family protein [Desulfohalotomaculum tongense]|uniref:universal stress protein n=1 Tax=Desulforadius tongensis TaxID=1216062 RepID=UPI00195965FD|nr:universal stress protein [Desulforadius tongensis]MBM7856134.1 nucleotide-binding universal stress UspA family protein [Desulforadius tongensis]
MYNKILTPVDGSERSKKAAVHAADLAEKFGAQLTILHVVSSLPSYYINSDRLSSIQKTLLDEFIKEGQQVLTKIKWDLSKKDVDIKTSLVVGNPADEICKLAHQESFDLIVMGSRGLGEIKGYIMGSISNRVVRHARCPVLIYR